MPISKQDTIRGKSEHWTWLQEIYHSIKGSCCIVLSREEKMQMNDHTVLGPASWFKWAVWTMPEPKTMVWGWSWYTTFRQTCGTSGLCSPALAHSKLGHQRDHGTELAIPFHRVTTHPGSPGTAHLHLMFGIIIDGTTFYS